MSFIHSWEKKRTSSGWCAGWVLVHCGLKRDPLECGFIISRAVFCSFLSPACPGRSGSCKECLGIAGGILLGSRLEGDYFRKTWLHENFPWYPATGNCRNPKLWVVPSHLVPWEKNAATLSGSDQLQDNSWCLLYSPLELHPSWILLA